MTNLARARFVIFFIWQVIVCPLNEAFAQDLTDFIVSNPIDYWIYGHHHFNQPDFKVGNTLLVTNQLGYVMREEHEGFDWERWVEV